MTHCTPAAGTLYIVATPLGNLQDITLRAIETLKAVDVIAAEDTRRAQILLSTYSIEKPIISLFEANEQERSKQLVRRLLKGEQVGLISDAGTPLISDPGYCLVTSALEADIPVVPLPGPCALIAALSASGLSTSSFYFAGFIPSKAGVRKTFLTHLTKLAATLIFYETPKRLEASILAMLALWGDTRRVVIARELTKQFEQFYRGSLQALAETIKQGDLVLKGEMVVLVEGHRSGSDDIQSLQPLLQSLIAYMPASEAVKILSQSLNIPKNKLYALTLNQEDK